MSSKPWEVQIGFIAVLAAIPVLATENLYECKLQSAYRADLQPSSLFDLPTSFTVNRQTGEIVGPYLTTVRALSTEVLYAGSTENSFRSIARFYSEGTKAQIQVIEVSEFKEGEIKPFIAMSMGGVGIAIGECK